MTQDFIFAQDLILILTRGRSSPSFETAGMARRAKIAVLVGAQMYDLNGNLLGKLAAGALPISLRTW